MNQIALKSSGPRDGSAIGRVVLQDGRQTRLFDHPLQIVAVHDPADVDAALRLITARVNEQGLYAAGFMAYEAAAAYDLVTHPPSVDSVPLLWFGLYDHPTTVAVDSLPARHYRVGDWRATIDWPTYRSAIEAIKAYIAAGHTYQVNYTMPLQASFSGDPWALYRDLTQSQQADYMAYLDLGRFVICSASPELFFQRDGRKLTSRPMKGTTARGRTLAEDHKQMAWLRASEKNRAENVMIVDMIRNDFGRIAQTGSVAVPELFTIERYPTLLQMTSTVSAESDASLADIMHAMFPCASITGAPKVRTMQLIRELEPRPRGIYTGSIGYIAPQRQANFNVAIRTVIIDRLREEATYGVGGGIVWDSEAEAEYNECFLKAEVLVKRRPAFELLETMRWEREAGYLFRDYHLQRLADSAVYFRFPFDRDAVEMKLDSLAAALQETTRVRLLLDKDGAIQVQSFPLALPQQTPVVRTALAVDPVSASEIWLYHKTTNRRLYLEARDSRPDADEVILWNRAGELTEATRSNIVLDLDGRLLTPPISSGLLNGTFRRHLLHTGQIAEQRLTPADLHRSRKVYLINSVRLWQEAALIDPD